MPYYQHNGINLYYFTQGQGEPVLLLHGITNSGRAFSAQLAALVNAGYQVIIPDHAGHGASPPVTQPYTVDELANDTKALLDHLGVQRAHIVGVSMGGMIAQQLVINHPEACNKLVIANSFPNANEPQMEAVINSWIEIFLSPNGAEKRFEQNWPLLVNDAFRTSPQGIETFQQWHAQASMASGESFANIAEGLKSFDVRPQLPNITQPTLVISGENDPISPPMLSEYIASQIPNANYLCIEGAHHLPNVDSTGVFNQNLITFL